MPYRRLLAWLKDEVPADDLEAFRAAGGIVAALLLDRERLLQQLELDGRSVWTAAPAARAQLVSTWCADALQTLGDTFLQTAYDVDPTPPGHVPELILRQALAFYHRVEVWVARARRAAVNPGYRLRADLPDRLTTWFETDPCPEEHLHALLAATRALGARAAIAVAEAQRTLPAGCEERGDDLRQLIEGAHVDAAGAAALVGRHSVSPALRRQVEERLQRVLAEYHVAGQVAADPRLLDRRSARAAPPAPRGGRGRRR